MESSGQMPKPLLEYRANPGLAAATVFMVYQDFLAAAPRR
jgi:hypothetical protein